MSCPDDWVKWYKVQEEEQGSESMQSCEQDKTSPLSWAWKVRTGLSPLGEGEEIDVVV